MKTIEKLKRAQRLLRLEKRRKSIMISDLLERVYAHQSEVRLARAEAELVPLWIRWVCRKWADLAGWRYF